MIFYRHLLLISFSLFSCIKKKKNQLERSWHFFSCILGGGVCETQTYLDALSWPLHSNSSVVVDRILPCHVAEHRQCLETMRKLEWFVFISQGHSPNELIKFASV